MLCSQFPDGVQGWVAKEYVEVHARDIRDVGPFEVLADQELLASEEHSFDLSLPCNDVEHPL